MKRPKKSAITVAFLAMLAGTEARANSVEVMVNDQNTTLDSKVGVKVASKVELFLRQIPTIKHDGEVGYFGYGSLGYNLLDHLNALVQAQALAGVGSAYGAGAEYFNQFGGIDTYGLADVAFWSGKPIAEFLLSIGYRPKLIDDLSLALNVEAFTQLSRSGHDFSVQKLRAGIRVGSFEVGPAVNVTEVGQGKDAQVGYEVGGSAKVDF